MPFDPTRPHTDADIESAELRNQFNGLKTLIDAVPAGPPGQDGKDGEVGPAGPAGRDGLDGAAGSPGADGVSVVSVQDSGDGRVMIGLSNGQTYGPFTAAAGPPGPVGSPGNDGSNGSNGSNGMDGVGIANIFDAGGGQLMVQLTNGGSYGPFPLPAGPQGLPGQAGPPGNDGTSGMNGADGVSVTNVYDAGGGQIVIQLSNGQQFGPFPLATGPQGLPGNDGMNGTNGMDGQNGADGVSITNIYDAGGGQLMVQLSNGSTYGPFTIPPGPAGPNGLDGAPGMQGPQGNDGVSVNNIYDAGGGQIMVQLSNGSTYGPFTIPPGPAGPNGMDGAPGMQGPQGNDGASVSNIYDAGGSQLMVQLSNGQTFGPFPLPAGPQGEQGPPGLPLRACGQWNQGQYYVGDSVVWNGINYVAQVTFFSGSSPDTDMNWIRLTGFPGAPGTQGPAGEVSAQQLSDAIATTSANSNSVATLNMAVPNPATLEDLQACVQTMANKIDELILALRK